MREKIISIPMLMHKFDFDADKVLHCCYQRTMLSFTQEINQFSLTTRFICVKGERW